MEKGMTDRAVSDSLPDMTFPCSCHGALTAALLLSATPGPAEEVVAFDAAWEWLMIIESGSSAQIDPASMDPDFLATWTTPSYNGPAFRQGTAPLSYGGLDLLLSGSVPPGTLMDMPAPGTRGAVYCRTAFDLAGELTNVQLDYLIDDGFILYLDGVRWTSVNMDPNATSAFNQLALITGNEAALTSLNTGTTISPGHHTLHLSMHNNAVTSSDLGFMLRLTGDLHRTLVPTLTMEASSPSLDGTPRFRLRAKDLDPAAPAILQESTDLSQWSSLFTFPPVPGGTELTVDLPAAAQRKYFRVTQ
jgi:hypothetical protein